MVSFVSVVLHILGKAAVSKLKCVSPTPKPWKCDVCKVVFRSRRQLYAHQDEAGHRRSMAVARGFLEQAAAAEAAASAVDAGGDNEAADGAGGKAANEAGGDNPGAVGEDDGSRLP